MRALPERLNRDREERCAQIPSGARRGRGYRGPQYPKNDIPRRAKVGYCPCRARATHIAIPPMCKLGEYSRLRGRVGVWWLANIPGVHVSKTLFSFIISKSRFLHLRGRAFFYII